MWVNFRWDEEPRIHTTPCNRILKSVCWIAASIAITLWFSSCNKGKSDFSEYYPKIEFTDSNAIKWSDIMNSNISWWDEEIIGIVNVDVTWWNKKIEIIKSDWWYYNLMIWDQVIAKLDKNCQYCIKYKDGIKPISSWEFLQIDENECLYVMLKPLIDSELISDEEFGNLKSYIIIINLFTHQEVLVSWLDKLKKIAFQVGKSYDLTKLIDPHNVTIEEITIRYPSNDQEEKIDDRTNFIPNQACKGAKIEIKVGDNEYCTAKIDIFPKDRESIESIFESPSVEETFPNLNNQLSGNDYKYVEENLLVLYKMIQTMLHHGTTKFSPEEIKEYLEKTVIVFVDKPSWDQETIWWWNAPIEQLSTQNNVLRALIPDAKIENIEDDSDNPWSLKMVKYAQAHPEEIIIVCVPLGENNYTEPNYEKNIKELSKMKNVLVFEEWSYSDINLATLWMISQLNPNIKDAKKLLAMSNLNTNLDKSKLFSIIKNLMPVDLSFNINLWTYNWKYKIRKWEYLHTIFDIQWTILEYDSGNIPCDKEYWYIIKNIDFSWCDQYFTPEKLIEYSLWEKFNIWWNLIILDENWKKLLSIPVFFERKNNKLSLWYNIR